VSKELDDLVATQDIIQRVKYLIDDKTDGLLNIDQVSQKLNLTKRTLQRMLKEKERSFQLLYDEVRGLKLKIIIESIHYQR
jgi:AraC-like DNA-binding protein